MSYISLALTVNTGTGINSRGKELLAENNGSLYAACLINVICRLSAYYAQFFVQVSFLYL